MFTQNAELTSSPGVVVGGKRAPTRIALAFGHHLSKWRPVISLIILFAVIVAPFYVAAHAVGTNYACPTVSAAPTPAKGPAKATPGRSSTLGYISFPGAPSQSLAESRCAFNSNLKRVSTAQSTTLSDPESTIATFTTGMLKKASYISVALFTCWLLSVLYFAINRHGSSSRKKAKGDDIHIRVRLFVGPIAWILLGFSTIWPQQTLTVLTAPTHGIAALSSAGPLSPSQLSASTYHVAEANAFGSVMFGLNSPSQLKAAAPSLDAAIKGKPVSKATFNGLTKLYRDQVTSANQAGTIESSANAVKKVATSLNTVSTISSQGVLALRAAYLAIFTVICFWLLWLLALKPVRAWRYFKRWIIANAVVSGLLLLSYVLLLALNWGGFYAVSYITAPGKQGVMWGWASAAYAFQIIGYIAPWLVFASVYSYYRITSAWIIKSMCKSDDKWVSSLGNRLVMSRQRHVIMGKLLFMFPRFRRNRQLVVVRQGGI